MRLRRDDQWCRRLQHADLGRSEEVGWQYTMTALGRLFEVEQFEDIIVKVGDDGGLIHLRDVARIELGAQTYDTAGAYF